MLLHAFGDGYVPIVSGRTHCLLDKSNRQRSLKVVIEQVQPPNTYMEFSCTTALCEYLLVMVGAIATGVIDFHDTSKSIIALWRLRRLVFVTSTVKKTRFAISFCLVFLVYCFIYINGNLVYEFRLQFKDGGKICSMALLDTTRDD